MKNELEIKNFGDNEAGETLYSIDVFAEELNTMVTIIFDSWKFDNDYIWLYFDSECMGVIPIYHIKNIDILRR